MILYQKKPFKGINMRNMVLFDDTVGDSVIYVGLETYTQALSIAARFDNVYGDAWKFCNGGKLGKEDPAYEWAKTWRSTVPEPLNYLAWAFGYIKDAKVDWTKFDREKMFGLMHEMSMMMDFNACTILPAEVRAKISIPTGVLLSYKTSWASYTESLADLVIASDVTGDSTPISKITVGQLKSLIESVASKGVVVQSQRQQVEVMEEEDEKPMRKVEPPKKSGKAGMSKQISKPGGSKKAEEVEPMEENDGEEQPNTKLKGMNLRDIIDSKAAKAMGLTLEQYREQQKNLSKQVTQAAKPTPPVTAKESVPVGMKTQINGVDVAKFDAAKAEETKDALMNFEGM